jgi:hypothetical protein
MFLIADDSFGMRSISAFPDSATFGNRKIEALHETLPSFQTP